MADDLLTQSTSPATVPAGIKIATEDVAGVHHQKIKIEFGPDGGATLVDTGTPLPVSVATVPTHAVTISGTPSVSVSNWPGTQPISGNVGITGSVDTELPTAVTLTDVLSNPTTPLVGAVSMAWDPANGMVRVRGDTGFGIDVDVTRSVLPTGAATAAKQPAFGTTGVPSADVLTVQGNASGVAIPVSLATVPSHAVTVTSGSLTADTELAPAAAFGDGLTAANLGTNVPAVQAVGVGFDGTNYDRVRVANAGTQIAGGTAGVLVVQGTGAAGAIPITGSVTAGGMQDNGAFVDNSSLVSPAGFIFDETAGTALTENDVAAGRIDSKRAQIMVIEDATTRGAARRAQVTTNGELIIAGSGVAGTPTGTQALTVQGIGGMFPLDVAEKGTWVMPDDAAFAVASSRVAMSGFLADEVATDSVDEGDGGAARMTLDRRQIVVPTAHTQGGSSPFYNLDVDETEDAIKATAGQLYELYLNNTTNAQLYVKLYDGTVASVVVGTTTPAMVIPVPGNNDLDGAGVVRQWVTGLAFATAITIAATTGAADNDTGAPSTGALIASGAYK